MASTDIQRRKIYALLSAIKTIDQTPKLFIDNTYDQYRDRLDSTNGIVKKGITSFTSKIKGGTQNKKNIFEEIINLGISFLGDDKEDPVNPKTKNLGRSKMLKYAKLAAQKTLQSSNETINTEVKKTFFGGTGLCNSVTTLGTNSIEIAPKEFDFLGMLKVDPSSVTGKLMYENPTPNITGSIKFNRELYNNFTSNSPYYFNSLFDLTWNNGTQKYLVNNLEYTLLMGDFLDNYYNSIEYPDIEHILKTAMQMVLGGDATESKTFKIGMKNLNRLLTKLFSICGKPSTTQPLLNTTDTELTEDETDIENYFDFDDIEGIDLDEEDALDRRVLKFRDCNNFEVPLNANYPEDFAYQLDKKPIDENVMNTINKAAKDAFEAEESGVPFEGFQISLITGFILKIPRALIASLLSPKIFFPIVVVYKIFKGSDITAKELMRALYNLFYNFIRKIFWRFIKEFWALIKGDLLIFVSKIAARILMNKLKKIKMIVQILINIIRKVIQRAGDIGSCDDIFGAILLTIQAALNRKMRLPIPGALLILSELLPGFSSDRAYINIVERLQASGVNMGPIYGSENKLPLIIKGIVDGYSEEVDTNSFVKISLKSAVVGAGTNGYGIIPFAEGVGKMF